jgi:prevent-host-death family protein
MNTIGASKFKEQCLFILEHLDQDGLVITKHGKPVARLLPYETSSSELIGKLKGKIKIKGNIFSTGIKWDAES